MRKLLAVCVMSTLTVPGLAAQAPQGIMDVRVSRAQPGKWEVPDCGLNKGNFMISSGGTYLKSGAEASDEVKKAKLYGDGLEVILDGIQKGQAGASGAWYYLGRAYLYLGDLRGADSALSRAQALAPGCAKDIQQTRRNTWVQLLNAGIGFVKAENTDSAIALFRQANMIYTGEPNAFTNLGVIYVNKQMPDSAIVYFREAVAASGSEAKAVEGRNQAQYNLAALLSNQARWKEAVPAWQQYLQWVPGDADAKKAYARALRADGQPDAAAAIERELISGGGGGRDGRPDERRRELLQRQELHRGRGHLRPCGAARAVEPGRPLQPGQLLPRPAERPGARQDGPRAYRARPDEREERQAAGPGVPAREEPADDREVLHRARGDAVLARDRDPDPAGGGASVRATATGRAAKTIDTKPIAAHPVTLIFEFLDKDMAVVASSERIVPALAVGETSVVEAEGLGAGIVGWKYRVK